MSIIAWIVLGLIAGFIASKVVTQGREHLLVEFTLGMIGSILGGALFNIFEMSGVMGLNPYSLVVAVLGAVIVLITFHAAFRHS